MTALKPKVVPRRAIRGRKYMNTSQSIQSNSALCAGPQLPVASRNGIVEERFHSNQLEQN